MKIGCCKLLTATLVLTTATVAAIYFMLKLSLDQHKTNNTSAYSPCDDFYQYACAEWEKNNNIPEDSFAINTFTKAYMEINQYFWKLMSDRSFSNNDPHLEDAQKYYRSCVNRKHTPQHNQTLQVHQLIKLTFGGWELLPELIQTTPENDTVKQFMDNSNFTDWILPILSSTGRSPMFSLSVDYTGKVIRKNRQEALRYTEQIAYDLGVSNTQKQKLNDAFLTTLEFVKEVLIPSNPKKSEDNYPITISALKNRCTHVDWDVLFEKIFGEAGFPSYKEMPILISEDVNFGKMCSMLGGLLNSSHGKSKLHNMLVLDFLMEQTKYEGEMSEENNLLHHEGSDTTFSTHCIDRLRQVFPWTLEKHFLSDHINESQRTAALNLIDEIRHTLHNLTLRGKWLDNGAKANAIDKISRTTAIALSGKKEDKSTIYQYPMDENNPILNEYYARKSEYFDILKLTLSSDDTDFGSVTPTFSASAAYNMLGNLITLHAGLIRPPFYNGKYDTPTKYAGLGSIIGHEFAHAVGISGTVYDANGTMLEESIAAQRSKDALNRTKCLGDFYSTHIDKSETYNAFTIDEILADNVGVKASYEAFQKLKGNTPVKSDLNSDSSPTSDQLYFLKYAKSFCGYMSEEGMLEHAYSGFKLQKKDRVNGVISNSKDFAKAYNCPVGSPMNPSEKCHLW
uniref:Peptidase_M13 domain-containing protein n=1 Tax=Trichobilharzia regenti TaxID=157069 RepID=A0AA85K1S3_TRIRE|nr:unnamed protein product [Trichobilharzia regenti]